MQQPKSPLLPLWLWLLWRVSDPELPLNCLSYQGMEAPTKKGLSDWGRQLTHGATLSSMGQMCQHLPLPAPNRHQKRHLGWQTWHSAYIHQVQKSTSSPGEENILSWGMLGHEMRWYQLPLISHRPKPGVALHTQASFADTSGVSTAEGERWEILY